MSTDTSTLIIQGAQHSGTALVSYVDRSKVLMKDGKTIDPELLANETKMTLAQATSFLLEYEVVDQKIFTSGFSVTLFRDKNTGETWPSVRGTDNLANLVTASIWILGGSPPYNEVETQIKLWQIEGKLQPQFAADGHSYGGYVVAQLRLDHPEIVSQVNMYNAPGQGGIFADFLDMFRTKSTDPNIVLYTTAGTNNSWLSFVTNNGSRQGLTIVELATPNDSAHGMLNLYQGAQDAKDRLASLGQNPVNVPGVEIFTTGTPSATQYIPPSSRLELTEKYLAEEYVLKKQIESDIQRFVGEDPSEKFALEKRLADAEQIISAAKQVLHDLYGAVITELPDGQLSVAWYLASSGGGAPSSFTIDPNNSEFTAKAQEYIANLRTSSAQDSSYSWQDFNHDLEHFFSSFQLSQSIDAMTNAFKYGDAVAQIQSLAVLAVNIDNWAEVHSGKDYMHMTEDERKAFSDETGLSNAVVAAAQVVASVTGAIEAFRYGDDLDRVSATLGLINTVMTIDKVGTGFDPSTTPLGGVVSAINTVQSVQAFSDAWNSGDGIAIAEAGTSLVYNAGMTYNAYAAYTGASKIPYLSYLGYVTGGLEIIDGHYGRGACTIVGTALMEIGMECEQPVLTFIGMAVVMLGAAFDQTDIPSATAHFDVDAGGHVIMQMAGDGGEVREALTNCVTPMLELMQNYAANGGRLAIPGEDMPSVRVTAGSEACINYGNGAGSVQVNFGSIGEGVRMMLGVLAARDSAATFADAVRVSTDAMGNVDTNGIDAYMASQGYTRDGAGFVSGEDKSEHQCGVVGTGIFAGGGQQGPVGQVMGVTGIISLPLRPDQLPSQTLGKIRGTTDLGQTFTGAGSGLLLAAMLAAAAEPPSAEAGVAPAAGTATGQSSSASPATGSGGTAAAAPPTAAEVLATLRTDEEITAYLDAHWQDLKMLADAKPGNAPPDTGLNGSLIQSALSSASLFSQLNATPTSTSGAGATASAPYDPFPFLAAVINNLPHTEPVSGTLADSFLTSAATSFSATIIQPPPPVGTALLPEGVAGVSDAAQPPEAAVPEPPPIPIGITVSMAEDTALRLVGHQLMENGTLSSESLQFSGLGTATHGRVWIDDNGDIRFQPDANFFGTASFSYFLQQPDGEVVERLAVIGVQNVNDAPELTPDHITLQQGQAFFLDTLLLNDSDADGDGLVLDHLRGVEHGQIITIDGRLAFMPDIDFTGDIELSYFVRDHIDAYPSHSTVTIAVEQADTAPVAGADHFLIAEDSTLTTTVEKLLRNDNDGDDGDKVAFAGLGAAQHGTVTQAADGSIVFTPEKGYTGGEAGFYYQIQDATGHTSQGWASVGIVDARHAPEQIADSLTISEDQPLLFDAATVAKFLSDLDGDKLFVEEVHAKSGGTVTVKDGLYLFTPDAGFTGTASFDYRANDGLGGIVTGTVMVQVEPVDKPPILGENSGTTDEDTPLYLTTASLLANSHDREGSEVLFAGLGAAKHGSVALTEDGRIEFTPEKDYNGNEAGFFYTAKDEAGNSSEGWVKVAVNPVNDAPVVTSQTLTINEDQSLTFTADVFSKFVYDADGEKFHFTAAPKAADGESLHGQFVAQKDGVYTFIPEENFHGDISFTYEVENGSHEKLSDTLTITIKPVDDATKFGDIALTTDEDQALTLAAGSLVDKATDADGALSFAGLGEAKHGTVTVGADGLITFTPDADYFGKEAGFSYTLKDADGNLADGWAKVAVNPVNDAPVVISQTLTINEDKSLTFTADVFGKFVYDADGEKFHFLSAPKLDDASSGHGRFEEKDGVYTFIPEANFHGDISFTYTVENDSHEKLSDTLTVTINSVDDATKFGDIALTTDEEQNLTVSAAKLVAAATDADGALHFAGLGQAQHGTVALGEDGNIVFTPDTDYFGKEAGFSYKLQDADGYTSEGFAKVTVNNVNDVPVVVSDTIHISEDQPFTFDDLSRFFYDADGDTFHFTAAPELVAADSGHGHFEKKGDIYTFTPEENYYGSIAFTYTVVNDSGEKLTGSMNINIDPVNDLPQAPLTKLSGMEGQEVTIDLAKLLDGVTDVEDGNYAAGKLHFAGISDSINGDAWVENGVLHFQAKDDFFGTAEVRYTVQDSEGGLGTGYIQYGIEGVQDTPVAKDDHLTVWSNKGYENVLAASRLLANDYDADGDKLSITRVDKAEFGTYGTVSLGADGNIHYTAPSADWIGVDSFTYTITDGHGGVAKATVEFEVKPNTSPDLKSEVIFSEEDKISPISQYDLLKNDNDIDGDKLTIISVDQAQHCTVTLLPDGSIAFAPDLNYNNDYYDYLGPASFRYTVSDGISDPVSAVAVVSLTPVNDAPVVVSEVLTGGVEDNTYVFFVNELLKNDWDVERDSPYETDNIHFAGAWGAAHGSLVYDQAAGTITYTPQADFNGLESFFYQITDDGNLTTVGESYIYVQPVNDIPEVQYDTNDRPVEDYLTTVFKAYDNGRGLLDNDSDADGDTLRITSAWMVSESGGEGGDCHVTVDGGDLRVTPAFHTQNMKIGYNVTDDHGGNVTSYLTIDNIQEHNFPPEFEHAYITGSWSAGSLVTDDVVLAVNATCCLYFSFTDRNKNIDSIGVQSLDDGKDSSIVVDKNRFAENPVTGSTYLVFTVEVHDLSVFGGWAQVSFMVTAIDEGNCKYAVPAVLTASSNGPALFCLYTQNTPVVLDLNGNGVELVAADAGTQFDWNSDGTAEKTGWVGANDGILAYDVDGDGRVTMAQEVSFKDYLPGALTDLQGLAHFDTNGDGVLDQNDKEWAAFGVWQDGKSDGVCDDGEFKSLDAMGIVSLSLTSDHESYAEAGNTVFGLTSYTTADGQTHVLGDVGLTGEKIGEALSNDASLAQPDTLTATGKDSSDTPSLTGENSHDASLTAAAPKTTTTDSAASTLAPTDSHDSTTSALAQKDNDTGHDSSLTADKTALASTDSHDSTTSALAQTDTTGHTAPNEPLADKAAPVLAPTDTASHAAPSDAPGDSLAAAGQHDSAAPAATPSADAPHADLPPPAMPSLDAIAIQLASDMATALPSDHAHDPGPIIVPDDTIAAHDTGSLPDDPQHHGFLS